MSNLFHFKPFFLALCFICKSLALTFSGEKNWGNKKVGTLYVCICACEVKCGSFEIENSV